MDEADVERQWFIVSRWQEYGAELRANLLRIVGIAAFFLVHIASYYQWFGLPPMEGADRRFHLAVTALAVAWILLALAVHVALLRGVFPRTVKYITTLADICLLTLMIGICDGPRSPLVVGYFLILALAAMRFSLPLIWCATGMSLASYLALLGYAAWYATRDKKVARHEELIMVVALALAGVAMGAVVRRVRRLAQEFSERMQSSP
jgi:hypothetical protein